MIYWKNTTEWNGKKCILGALFYPAVKLIKRIYETLYLHHLRLWDVAVILTRLSWSWNNSLWSSKNAKAGKTEHKLSITAALNRSTHLFGYLTENVIKEVNAASIGNSVNLIFETTISLWLSSVCENFRKRLCYDFCYMSKCHAIFGTSKRHLTIAYQFIRLKSLHKHLQRGLILLRSRSFKFKLRSQNRRKSVVNFRTHDKLFQIKNSRFFSIIRKQNKERKYMYSILSYMYFFSC